jgi:hypothetical protein
MSDSAPDAAPVNRRELEQRIIARARTDSAFKQELLRNPTETVFKELGIEHRPSGLKFQVVEETPETLYLVLPIGHDKISELASPEGVLSNKELAAPRRSRRVLIMKCEDV